jgi:hypothetical protein
VRKIVCKRCGGSAARGSTTVRSRGKAVDIAGGTGVGGVQRHDPCISAAGVRDCRTGWCGRGELWVFDVTRRDSTRPAGYKRRRALVGCSWCQLQMVGYILQLQVCGCWPNCSCCTIRPASHHLKLALFQALCRRRRAGFILTRDVGRRRSARDDSCVNFRWWYASLNYTVRRFRRCVVDFVHRYHHLKLAKYQALRRRRGLVLDLTSG